MNAAKNKSSDSGMVLNALMEEPEEWKMFGLLGAQMGLRPSEILDLQWGDIDLNAIEIRVSSAKTGGRILKVSDDVLQSLKKFKADAEPFAGISLADAKAWCADFSKRNGFDGLSVYSFRDMFVNNPLSVKG